MKTIYLTPHSHYDVVWAFNKEDYMYINEFILDKAIKMINENGFKFLIEQAYPLEQLEKRKPELFKDVAKAIADNKLEIVDGLYIMPDLMIPGGETLVREILVGKGYVKKKFGKDIPVAYAADTFGLNAQMPQIYRKSGYKWLIFRRGLPKLIGRKVSEFIWEGLDGSQLISHWMPMGYRAGLELDKWEESVQKLSELATTSQIYMPCGSGGTPPQEEIPQRLIEWNKKHDNAKMVMATPREFFQNFEKERRYLPTFKGELYSADLEDVFPDVVSSRISLKLAIKECENDLLLSEKMATLALLQGQPYPSDQLNSMWKKMLFLANHDVMPSCGIDEIYEEARQYIAEINLGSGEIISDSANFIVKESEIRPSKREDGEELCIAVFNPYNWTVTDWVEKKVELGGNWRELPGIKMNGREIPSEIIHVARDASGNIKKATVGFMASVRPLNHNVYEVTTKKSSSQSSIKVKENEVSTKFFNLKIDEKSGILQVFDPDGRKLMEGNEVIVDEELGDLYFHFQHLKEFIGSESGKGLKFSSFKPGGFNIEQGQLRTTITFKNTFYCLKWPYYLSEKFGTMLYRQKTLDLVKKVIVYEDIPRIDFMTHINLRQPHVRIRLKFDTGMITPQYARQTQFGALEISSEKIFEEGVNVPAPAWITAEEGGRGLGFITLGVPVNQIKAGEIYYTLLRSVSVLSADGISGPLIPTLGAEELGEHTYTYSVYPYKGNWRDSDIYESAYEFGQSLIPIQVNSAVNKKYQSISISPSNLIMSALKKAESEEAIIIRFFETEGKACKALLQLPSQIKAAKEVNLLEEDESDLMVEHGKLEMDVNPYEIVTLKLAY